MPADAEFLGIVAAIVLLATAAILAVSDYRPHDQDDDDPDDD